jgi:hypothetical protein
LVERPSQVEARIGADQPLGEVRRSAQEEVAPDRRRALLVEARVDRRRRDDVEYGKGVDGVAVVERQPAGHAGAPVVPGDDEPLVRERSHRLHLVLRHRPLRVRLVTRIRPRLLALPVAAEIRPHHVRLRVAVQEEDWRPGPAVNDVDRDAVDVDALPREAGERLVHQAEAPE